MRLSAEQFEMGNSFYIFKKGKGKIRIRKGENNNGKNNNISKLKFSDDQHDKFTQS